MKLNLKRVSKIVNGKLYGNPSLIINNISSFNEAKKGDISILRSEKQLSLLKKCKASALLIPYHFPDIDFNYIKVKDISIALAKLIPYYHNTKVNKPFISENAYIGKNCSLKENITIYPFVYISENCSIGKNTIIFPFVFIGDNVSIGNDCIIHPSVVIYNDVKIGNKVIIHAGSIIGADGFGYAREKNKFIKIPHIGKVIIKNNIEIGANTCIDRATLGKTIIDNGTKIDNLVQIAHNCIIGKNCALAGMVALAGSTTIGDRVLMGGQSGTAGHLSIGSDSIIGGQAGITHDLSPNTQAMGTPAIDLNQWKRINVLLSKLPELYKKIKSLENIIYKLTTDKN